MKVLPIVFTCDDSYFQYTCVVIRSIMENSRKDVKYEINIISESISEENRGIAQKMIATHPNFSIAYHIISIENREQYHLNSYMSLSTYYRFFIFDILKEYRRVLYLDSDLIVENDISFLADLNFKDKAAAACPSPYVQNLVRNPDGHTFTPDYFYKVLKMTDPSEYFNAGVILFNVEKIRKERIDKAFFEAISNIDQPIFQDQDILNSVIAQHGGVQMLPSALNYTPTLKVTKRRILLNALRCTLTNQPRNKWFSIYHYVGSKKPWQENSIDSDLFLYYAFKTPFLKTILKKDQVSKLQFVKLWFLSRI